MAFKKPIKKQLSSEEQKKIDAFIAKKGVVHGPGYMTPEMVQYNLRKEKHRQEQATAEYEKRFKKKVLTPEERRLKTLEYARAASEKKRREREEKEGFDIYESH